MKQLDLELESTIYSQPNSGKGEQLISNILVESPIRLSDWAVIMGHLHFALNTPSTNHNYPGDYGEMN